MLWGCSIDFVTQSEGFSSPILLSHSLGTIFLCQLYMLLILSSDQSVSPNYFDIKLPKSNDLRGCLLSIQFLGQYFELLMLVSSNFKHHKLMFSPQNLSI